MRGLRFQLPVFSKNINIFGKVGMYSAHFIMFSKTTTLQLDMVQTVNILCMYLHFFSSHIFQRLLLSYLVPVTLKKDTAKNEMNQIKPLY